MAWDKIVQGKEDWKGRSSQSPPQLTYKERGEGNQGVSHADIWRKKQEPLQRL